MILKPLEVFMRMASALCLGFDFLNIIEGFPINVVLDSQSLFGKLALCGMCSFSDEIKTQSG